MLAAASEDNKKLFTAVATDGVMRPNGIMQARGNFFQDFVTRLMTVDIIDLLEVVDIAKQD